MIAGHPQTAHAHQQQDQEVAPGDRHQGKPHPSEEHSRWQQEGLFLLVGEEPEEGLNNRGRKVADNEDGPCDGVRKPQVLLDEGQDHRKRPLVGVDHHMAAGQQEQYLQIELTHPS